ncbi:MAG: protease complex subunit PrcB family protein [Bacteroidota bacterium]
MKYAYYPILLLIALSIVACSSSEEAVQTEKNESHPQQQETASLVDWTLLHQGEMHGAGDEGIQAGYRVVRNAEELQQMLQKMQIPEIPEVAKDKALFDASMLLFLFDKVRTTGGYRFRTEKISQKSEQINVHTVSRAPKEDAPSMMTQPYLIIRLDQSSLPIKYQPTEK